MRGGVRLSEREKEREVWYLSVRKREEMVCAQVPYPGCVYLQRANRVRHPKVVAEQDQGQQDKIHHTLMLTHVHQGATLRHTHFRSLIMSRHKLKNTSETVCLMCTFCAALCREARWFRLT